MNEALEAAIKSNAIKSDQAKSPDDAVKFAQAALNAANALTCLSSIKK